MAKTSKRPAMGKGLSALFKEPIHNISSASDQGAEKVIGNMVVIEVEAIEANPFQPRINFNAEELQELAHSIKELGVIQPITVRKLEGNRFQLVSGERRWRAAKSIGMETIPAYVRIADDGEMLEMALVENIQRRDLDPIEVALSYQRMIDELEMTQEDLSKRVGKKRATVTNYLRLLKLDPIVQMGMRDGFISMGHGRALVNIESFDDQMILYKKIIDKSLSVRQTEELVKQFRTPKTTTAKAPVLPEHLEETRQYFSDFFGQNVKLKVGKNGKGQVMIPFNSQEDLIRIKKLLS
ncbi:MAG: chromosome partitioning protein ParB [Flavobacteriia bacterium]|nr:MAG: chromosome partitioning protein ParB [Flavobacteriia bacterium]